MIMTQETKLKSFSELLKSFRKKLKYSQEKLAQEVGVSLASIQRWESGKCEPFALTKNIIKKYIKKELKNEG